MGETFGHLSILQRLFVSKVQKAFTEDARIQDAGPWQLSAVKVAEREGVATMGALPAAVAAMIPRRESRFVILPPERVSVSQTQRRGAACILQAARSEIFLQRRHN